MVEGEELKNKAKSWHLPHLRVRVVVQLVVGGGVSDDGFGFGSTPAVLDVAVAPPPSSSSSTCSCCRSC